MAFDVAPRGSYQPESPPRRELRKPADWRDAALRVIVLLPLIALYTWWVFGVLGDLASAVIARFFS